MGLVDEDPGAHLALEAAVEEEELLAPLSFQPTAFLWPRRSPSTLLVIACSTTLAPDNAAFYLSLQLLRQSSLKIYNQY